jgi:hypothetical protein
MSKNTNWNPTDYTSFEDIKSELDRFQIAQDQGKLSTTGGWTSGQILEHCGKLIGCSIDGFEAKVPWFIKVFGVLVFKPMLGKSHMKPGIKLPKNATSLLPAQECSFDDGMKVIRDQITRIDNGEQMDKKSPVLGKMRHDQFVLLHLDHCRLHFGFIKCD